VSQRLPFGGTFVERVVGTERITRWHRDLGAVLGVGTAPRDLNRAAPAVLARRRLS
jgi:hypothetical protein